MTEKLPSDPPTSKWSEAFKDPSAFAALFAENVVLEASALRRPAVGRDLVHSLVGAGARMYREITFTDPVTAGNKAFSEWHAVPQDGDISYDGVTVLTMNDDGAITHVAIHHRPLDALLHFSGELGQRLSALLPPGLFYTHNHD